MEENKIKVYVKVDANSIITDINSSIFITNVEGWVQIAEGTGDNYSHAQNNYLSAGIRDDKSYNYKLVNNKPVELTAEEKETLFPVPKVIPTKEELLAAQLLQTQATLAELQLIVLMKMNGGM